MVGERLKSTRHRYLPESDAWLLSIRRVRIGKFDLVSRLRRCSSPGFAEEAGWCLAVDSNRSFFELAAKGWLIRSLGLLSTSGAAWCAWRASNVYIGTGLSSLYQKMSDTRSSLAREAEFAWGLLLCSSWTADAGDSFACAALAWLLAGSSEPPYR